MAVKLNKKENFQTVNSVRSPYGRDNLDWFINDNIEKGNLLAVNIEKANELLRSIEKSYLKENTFISFDNSIAYSLRSVKFPVKEENSKVDETKDMSTMKILLTVRKGKFNEK